MPIGEKSSPSHTYLPTVVTTKPHDLFNLNTTDAARAAAFIVVFQPWWER